MKAMAILLIVGSPQRVLFSFNEKVLFSHIDLWNHEPEVFQRP